MSGCPDIISSTQKFENILKRCHLLLLGATLLLVHFFISGRLFVVFFPPHFTRESPTTPTIITSPRVPLPASPDNGSPTPDAKGKA